MRRAAGFGLLLAVTMSATLVGPALAATPVAADDNTSTSEDTAKDINVLGNDTFDAPGTTVTIGTDVAHGSTSVGGNNVVTYTPAADFSGSDSFTYTISDADGTSNEATVDITVNPVDDPPVAGDDSASVNEGGSVDIDVLSNDTDIDTPHGSLTISSLSNPPHGSVSVVGGKVRYVPDSGYSGSDSFTYRADDGPLLSNTATVNVTVNAVNQPPSAADDTATVAEDTPTNINVLGNDGDPDGDPLSIVSLTNPPHGTATVSAGQVHYVPDSNYNGSDSFTYKASDGQLTSGTATVHITVTAKNDPPVADNDEFTVTEDQVSQPLFVLAGDTDVDGDTLTIKSATNGAHGVVAIAANRLSLTYDPNPNYFGDDTFTYTVTDGLLTDVGTVTVHVGGANDPPVAAPNAFDIPEGARATALDVLGNDTDPDGNTLIIVSATAPAHGSIAITGNGTGLTYDPTGNYVGPDKFKYTITDGNGGSSTANVLITVVRDTAPPVVAAPVERFIGQTLGVTTAKVRLSWGATDTGSGVASYKLQVSTNGGAYKTVALSRPTSRSVDWTFSTGRSYRFRVRATDKEGNASSYKYGPTLTAARYGEGGSNVTYVGVWSKTTTAKAFGGITRHSGTPTRSATLLFTGYDAAWIATRYTSSGKARVYVDDVLVKTIDLDTSSTAYRKLVFQLHFATRAEHRLRIVPVGDGRVDIDGFAILR